MRYACYAFTDVKGEAVYVGQTANLSRRIEEHSRLAPWWYLAAELDFIQWVDSRDEAREIEKCLIKLCKPRFNQVHGDRSAAVEYIYLAQRRIDVDAYIAAYVAGAA